MESPLTRESILIIDDDQQVRELLAELLQPDHCCLTASSVAEARLLLDRFRFGLVIMDIDLGEGNGLQLVPKILDLARETVVVMISGQHGIESAIDAMRAGAFDYITKPIDVRHVRAAVDRALAQHHILKEKRRYEDHLEDLVKERTAQVERLAYHDHLTDLPNRLLFGDRTTHALESARREDGLAAVLLVSLDRFKKISDTLGHLAGDTLLVEAALRLKNCLREGDTVARFDGDEFAVLLTPVDSAGEVEQITRSISAALRPPFHLDRQEVYVTASIGISLFPVNGEDGATILKNAGAAVERAQKRGGNNHQFYTGDMNAQAVTRLALETSLRLAV